MRRETKAIVAAFVAVAAVAVAAVCLMHDDDGGVFSPRAYPASHLAVLGNADLDLDIDEDDAEFIQALIGSGEPYDYADVYMCDANGDGRVDQSDVDMVRAMAAAQTSGDWSAVGTVRYVNVDLEIAEYNMTGSDKVITLIAPPLDSVLAMGGRDVVVGFDSRITTGKYHSEYARTFDFSIMYDVGSCNEPDTEVITSASKRYGGVTVVCGTRDSYGPTMESVFDGTEVQVVRVASWEYGGTMYGFMTLAYLLKHTEGAAEYYEWYMRLMSDVEAISVSAPESIRSNGAAAAYGYTDELSLLGRYTGEHACLASLGVEDAADAYLGGLAGGGHGNTVSAEAVSSMYQSNGLRYLVLMIGAPFQVETASGDAESTAVSYRAIWNNWHHRIGADTMEDLSMCITGYSFGSGVSDVLDRLILCYWLYNDLFMEHYGCADQGAAQDVLAGFVDAYCEYIGIDGAWSFYGEANGGRSGTLGMNLLYCGEGDSRNIMYGPEEGSAHV